MGNNQKKEQKLDRRAIRILYAVIVASLCLVVIIVGIVAVANRANTPAAPAPAVGGTDTEGGNEPSTPVGGNDNEEPVVEQVTYLCPLSGVVCKSHDAETLVPSSTMGDWRVHTGMDIAAPVGDAVRASAAGTVKEVWEDPLMGMCVSVDHGNGVVTEYKNLSETLGEGVAAGKALQAGDVIGAVGESALAEMADAPHLHFEVRVNGELVDPLTYLSEESCSACFHEQEEVYED